MDERNIFECYGNKVHWSHAFYKFGYDDGDGYVETHLVAEVLESAGYHVKYGRWSPHNTIIYSITKDGLEYMPVDNSSVRIGYDFPENYLPKRIQDVLNCNFSSC